MKLAEVEHYRCDQPAGKWGLSTYVWIPDDMSEHEFGLLCEAARDKYLENERENDTKQPALPIRYLDLESTPPQYSDSMTVAEVRAKVKEQTDIYKVFEIKRAQARKSFSKLLVEVSNGVILQFWDEKLAATHKLRWGHNHGVTVLYGETKIGDYSPEPPEEENYA